MERLLVSLPGGRAAQVWAVGPDDGRPVLYFHSPATGGEELSEATAAATRCDLRVFTVRRPSIDGDQPDRFVQTVANDVGAVVEALKLGQSAVLGWSGGAPYALAASATLGTAIWSIHLVSPLPGPLTGAHAVPNLSDRLQEVATTTAASSWISGPAALRDYQAVAAPWAFDVDSITRPVTIWAPRDDQIVPPHLIDHLAQRLPDAKTVKVAGSHDWLAANWATVLDRIAG